MKVICKNSLIKIDKLHARMEMLTLSARYEIKNFIETGTHLGETILFMAEKWNFDSIHSIEISEFYINFIKENFLKEAESRNINVSNVCIEKGDSVKVLPLILANIEGRSIFWLDAHCSAGDTERHSDYDCTILKELEIIKSSPIKDNVIVIDDINCCVAGISDYPKVSEIKEAIWSINKDYLITVKYDILFAEVVSAVWRAEGK